MGHDSRQIKAEPGTARYTQVQLGTARNSAEKTHRVLYFRKSGASRISNMILRGPRGHMGTNWGPLEDHMETNWGPLFIGVEPITQWQSVADKV